MTEGEHAGEVAPHSGPTRDRLLWHWPHRRHSKQGPGKACTEGAVSRKHTPQPLGGWLEKQTTTGRQTNQTAGLRPRSAGKSRAGPELCSLRRRMCLCFTDSPVGGRAVLMPQSWSHAESRGQSQHSLDPPGEVRGPWKHRVQGLLSLKNKTTLC